MTYSEFCELPVAFDRRFELRDGAPVERRPDENGSPSLDQKSAFCLANGAKESWIVDPARRKVDVFTSAGRFSTYTPGQGIPLLFGGELAVDRILDVLGD